MENSYTRTYGLMIDKIPGGLAPVKITASPHGAQIRFPGAADA
ncbi:hypothetical protein [Streptomyces sp. WAC 06783]|nr:hypothetical protein [Streptomyces sp. WAC 06783]